MAGEALFGESRYGLLRRGRVWQAGTVLARLVTVWHGRRGRDCFGTARCGGVWF